MKITLLGDILSQSFLDLSVFSESANDVNYERHIHYQSYGFTKPKFVCLLAHHNTQLIKHTIPPVDAYTGCRQKHSAWFRPSHARLFDGYWCS